MGERDRSQSYSGRSESGYENRDDNNRDQTQRWQRDNDRDDVRHSQGRDHRDAWERDRNYGDRSFSSERNYNSEHNDRNQYATNDRGYYANNERSYFGNRNQDDRGAYGQHYGQHNETHRFGGQDNRYGSDWDQGRRFDNQGGFGAGNYGQHNYGQQNYGQNNPYGYGQGFDRNYGGRSQLSGFGQEQRIGLYGSEGYRSSQEGNLHRDWNARGYPYESEARNYQRGFGTQDYYNQNNRGSQRNDEDSFGQTLRDAGSRVARKVKRAFRGPKGYKRSDDRIREDLSDRLAEQNELDPSEIEVAVSNGDVTLTGQVNSRHEKFIAEEIADDINGVNDVHNQLRVRREQQSQGTSSLTGDTSSTIANQNSTEAQRRNARA
jgi:osmotically-inducible protein OsmY